MNQRLYSRLARFGVVLPALLGVLALAGCGGVESKPQFPDRDKDNAYKGGSLLSEEGGITLLGGRVRESTAAGLTVNAFLWRASLDTVSFLPISSADAVGGTIITDWYVQPELPNERIKLNVFILSRELRADGVRVRAFKQVRNNKGDWTDAAITENVASSLEETILTRARQLRLTQTEQQ